MFLFEVIFPKLLLVTVFQLIQSGIFVMVTSAVLVGLDIVIGYNTQ
jgi:hypothetical protein